MNCGEFQTRVSAYPDRDTGSEELAARERHAASCANCAGELTVYRAMREGLGELPSLGAREGFEERLFARLEREEAQSKVLELPAWVRPMSLALAAGLVVFVVGMGVLRDDSGGQRNRAALTPGTDATGSELLASADSGPAATMRAGEEIDDEVLGELLTAGGIPLEPPGGERMYVIDRATDMPSLLTEGQAVSSPITF